MILDLRRSQELHHTFANPDALQGVQDVVVQEYRWGAVAITTILQNNHHIDLMIGSDVAYGQHSHKDLLIASLQWLRPNVSFLIGLIIMMDTRPEFFLITRERILVCAHVHIGLDRSNVSETRGAQPLACL